MLSCVYPVFKRSRRRIYRILLRHLLLIGHLQKMESGGLIIGRAGEKVVSDYHFLAVFQVPEYYLVKDENRSMGTVDGSAGHAFCLCWANVGNAGGEPEGQGVICQAGAGHLDCDWDVDFTADLHTTLVQKMKYILLCGEQYLF